MNAEAGVRETFESYASALNAADASAVTTLFTFPVTIWQFGAGHVFLGEPALRKNIEAMIDVLDEAAIKRMLPEIRAVHVAGDTAFADVLWRQQDEDGIELNTFACRYLLLHRDNAWRIATVVTEG